MKITKFVLLPIALFILFAGNTTAQTTPAKGSAERKAIMDALRANAKNIKGLSGKIIFTVSRLQVQNGWAFIVATPQSADGKSLTTFQSWCEYDQDVIALLKKRGNSWRVVARDVCPSDVSYGDWDKRYGAPRSILGL
jgi:hypothetical protein